VTLNGRDIYLGANGTKTSRDAYDRHVAEWLAFGRQLPTQASITIAELVARYLAHVDGDYASNEPRSIRLALKPVRQMYGETPASDFGPPALKTVRQHFIDRDLCRTEINKRIGRISRLFRWGAAEQLIPATVHQALKAVDGLKLGRGGVRESPKVKPVADAVVDAVQPFLSRQVAAMVELQRLTGMRPGEACQIRTWRDRPRRQALHRDGLLSASERPGLDSLAAQIPSGHPDHESSYRTSPRRSSHVPALRERLRTDRQQKRPCGLAVPKVPAAVRAARAMSQAGSRADGRGEVSTAAARPTKPALPNAALIPEELKARRQWVVWRYEFRDGKGTKIPYQAAHPRWKAKANVPSTWSTFDAACQAYMKGGFDGIGYVFSVDDPYFGMDVDNCLINGEVAAWALPHIEMVHATYGEVSPSGRGIKFIGKGKLPEDKGTRKNGFGPDANGAIELYESRRFFTITGNVFGGSSTIVELPEAAFTLYRVVKPEKTQGNGQAGANKPMETIPGPPVHRNGDGYHPNDDEVLRLIRKSKDSAKFDALWSGQ
jgi:hypothetical protein